MDETEKRVCDKETELVAIGHCLNAAALNSEETGKFKRRSLQDRTEAWSKPEGQKSMDGRRQNIVMGGKMNNE